MNVKCLLTHVGMVESFIRRLIPHKMIYSFVYELRSVMRLNPLNRSESIYDGVESSLVYVNVIKYWKH